MSTLKESAQAYQPSKSRNIAELPEVSVDLHVFTEKRNEGKENEFEYKYIEVNGEDYRVPDKVLKDLQAILAKKPTLKKFSVSKSGQGMSTQYTVIPLE